MGRRLEHHTLAAKRRMNAVNIRHLKVNGRAALRLLSRRHDPDQEPDSAAIEEGHLGRRCEEKGQAQCIPVEGDSFFEVLDRYQQLSDPCIRKIHLLSPGSHRFGRYFVGARLLGSSAGLTYVRTNVTPRST